MEREPLTYDSQSSPLAAPSFEITHETAPSESLVAGFSNFGLAGLTAADFLVDHLDLEETGHVSVDQLPAITPFEKGTPRHHTRFFSRPDLDVTVLVGELFVPMFAAEPFSDAILDWTTDRGVSEVTVLSGIPVAHGPEDHKVFYVATRDYQSRRLGDGTVTPMGNGFLDGVNARLVERGMTSDLAVGVLVTPVHPQAPDVQAAIRLVSAVADLYDLTVDTDPLQAFADEVREYYAELGSRLESVAEQQRPDDRMYM